MKKDQSKLLSLLVRTLVIGMLLWLVAGWFFPGIFTQIYESSWGEKLRLGRYPVEKWLKQWNSIWARGFIVGTTLTLGLLAINSSSFRNWFDRTSPHSTAEKIRPRSRWTRAPFYILGIIILLGQTVDVLISREHWPFSHFPMYTGIQTQDYFRYRVDGVLEDGSDVSLTQYFVPLSPGKIQAVVANYGRRDPEEHVRRCAKEYFDWYCRSRELGRHEGPEIKAARIYRLDWVLQEDGANIESPKKTLMAQFPFSQEQESSVTSHSANPAMSEVTQ